MDQDYDKDLAKQYNVLTEIIAEIRRAKTKHPGDFKNLHEAYAVFLEEADELWDEIKLQEKNLTDIKEEAIQAAAMLVRLVVELT